MRCLTPTYVWPNGKVIAVPCGKCLACLSNKRQDWSTRLMQEYKVCQSAFFVTLTYSDKFVPRCGVVKRHLQLYLKRLRKVAPRLRYYAVGEYGSKTLRPHYHAILFNSTEAEIRKAWSLLDKRKNVRVPVGIVHVGKVTEASVSYVLKYVVQPDIRLDGCNDPFAIMSRGYGLGLNYLTDEMVKWHRENDYVFMCKYGQKMRLPRFYKDKIWPNSEWSDWKFRRESVLKKARTEAEEKEAEELNILSAMGYSSRQMEEFRNAEISRVRKKVAHSQKF